MKDLSGPGLIGLAVDSAAARAEQALSLAQLADTHHADLVSVHDELWVADKAEAWTLLTMLAARTDRVAVLPNVAIMPMRPLVLLAKIVASLSTITGGRVALGLGAGAHLDLVAAAGGARRTTGESIDALAEAIPLLQKLWTAGASTAAHDGEFYDLGEIEFGPIPPNPVPIWTGAFGPRMLELTGRLADGWLPMNYFLDLADIPGMKQRIDTAAVDAGRDPSDIRRVFNVVGTITDTGPTENGSSLVGPPSLWVDALNDYHERLGFDGFVFLPDTGDQVTQAHRFFEEVRPALPSVFQPV